MSKPAGRQGAYHVNKGFMDDFDSTLPLGTWLNYDIEIRSIMWCYRSQVRLFETGLWAIDTDGQRFEVASIDCCDSTIHVHRLRRSAPTDRQSDRRTIVELSEKDYAVVDTEYQVQMDWICDQWEALVRSWHAG